jgi:heme/copper-type cytochrome/quinol oxidase subunit 4
MESRSMMVTILGAAEIGLIIAACYFLSMMVGSSDTGNELVKTIVPVTGILGGIIMVHTLLWYMYFQYEPMAMNLYFLVSGSMSMIISVVALSISLVMRQ